MKILSVICVLVVAFMSNVSAISTYYMDLNCGTTISMNLFTLNTLKLKLTSSYNYRRNMNCAVTISAPLIKQRLMLYFKSMGIEGSIYSCNSDYLMVYDGSSSSSSYVSGLYGEQCGHTYSSTIYKTTSDDLFLQFTSDSSIEDTGFTMIITAFSTGICASYEYKCDNGRCIDNTIKCNGYNPCGDHSDCPMAAGAVAGIVIGGIAFTVFVVVVVIIVVVRRRRYRHVQCLAAGAFVTSTTYGAGYNQPVPATSAPPPYPETAPYPGSTQYPGTTPYPAAPPQYQTYPVGQQPQTTAYPAQ